jgi:pimeloyl-ACP methyl ester carboxylesterase
MTSIRTETLKVSGIQTVVRSGGVENTAEAVVFVHGNPGSGEDWSELMPAVASVARVVAPDMPGYGRSQRPRRFDYSVSGYARFLGELVHQLALERVHLVLHDFGGMWGLDWARRQRHLVASLTLMNTGVLLGFSWHKFAKVWRTPGLGELMQLVTTRRGLRSTLNRDNPRRLPRSFTNRLFDDTDWASKRAALKLYRATGDPATLTTELGVSLKELALPALVIWGEADPYVPAALAECQRDYFRAEVHRLAGVGHWPMIDDPRGVEGLLVPFLRRQVTWMRSG